MSEKSARSGVIRPEDASTVELAAFRWQPLTPDCADSPSEPTTARNFDLKPFADRRADGKDSGTDQEKARNILSEAQKKAGAIIEKALEKAKTLEKEALNKGHREGRTSGLEQGRLEGVSAFEAEIRQTRAVLKAIENFYNDLLAVNEVTLVKLTETIAEKVVLNEAASSRRVITGAVKAALASLQDMHEVVFRMHPEDLRNIQSIPDELKNSGTASTKIIFEPDPALARGDLIVETSSGRIDATLKRRLQTVCAAVDQALLENSKTKDFLPDASNPSGQNNGGNHDLGL